VTTEDFVACMEQVSGLDLTQFRRWYTQAGTPHLKVSASYDADGKTYTLRIEQSCPPTPGQPQKEAFYIPFAMALLDAKGKEIPLFLEGAELPELHPIGLSTVLTLKDRVNTFVFTNISEKPIPSLLRSFSAPVKMSMEYTLEELMFLMSHDSDGFVRWESSQQLYLQIIHDCMQHRIEGKNPQVDKQLLQAMERVLKTALQDHGIDRAMISRLLLLPSEAYIGELTSEIDVDGIHETREHVRQHIALSLEKPLAELFQLMQDEGPYRVESSDIARRALKNTVLNYLVLLSDEWLEVAYLQYQTANNMTDQSAGLRALLAGKSEKALALKESAYAEFYQRWQHEPLVIEQWLSMQAGVSEKENLSEVILLTQHESFDIKNPNKVRSVIGSFSHQNIVGFHHESGSGYRFLSDKVIELNRINPQIAARLLTPLTQWHKHQANRQSLMKSELERISREKKLSSDVYEVVSKSMEQTDSS
jgi:aminopeptidase N